MRVISHARLFITMFNNKIADDFMCSLELI